MNEFTVRPLEPGNQQEIDRLYEICLRTGDNGNDATNQYADPHLIGEIYVGAYAVLHPEYCLVLESPEGKIVGYTVGTPDSQAFDIEQHQVWWPRVRAQYPLNEYPLDSVTPTRKDAELVNTAHTFAGVDEEIFSRYPAHFHIDLLPEGQGGGRGRLMLESLLTVLKEAGATAVHLGVSSANEPAVGFYRHLGFHKVRIEPWGLTLGKEL